MMGSYTLSNLGVLMASKKTGNGGQDDWRRQVTTQVAVARIAAVPRYKY